MGAIRAAWRQKLLPALATPASGEMAFGFKSDGKLWKKDSSGVESLIEGGSGLILADSGWITASLQNGFAHYGNGFDLVQYRKVGNIVYIRGFMTQGSNVSSTVIFTLPAGYRPADTVSHIVATTDAGNAARFNVSPDGGVRVNSGWSGGWATLGYTSFPVDSTANGVAPVDTGWQLIPFQANFTNFDATTWQIGRYKKINDQVYVEGLVKRTTGSGNAPCQLPAGFRPSKALIFATQVNGAFSRMDVTTDGGIAINGGAAITDGGYISINCTFSTGT